MPLTTSRELLASYNLLNPDDKNRHPKHEFQAFAYKLAHDLNDLVNLRIYMRLAKTVERSLMESAYSYALDAQTDNKGRKFFWKLKQLRIELKDRINAKNYDYDFVFKNMKVFRDNMSEVLYKRNSDTATFSTANYPSVNLKKILIVNCSSDDLINNVKQLQNCKLVIIEYSRSLKKSIESGLSTINLKYKVTLKEGDFLKNKFKDNYFDLIILNDHWSAIPVEVEKKYLNEIGRILADRGFLQLSTRVGEGQEWKTYKHKDMNFKYFLKYSNEKTFEDILKVMGFEILKKMNEKDRNFYITQKL
jgi:ubiquinone/menaquinone biosynthesis C-methylase UbiE